MGWAVGYDTNWQRDIGYGVPAICDHPDCDKEIDRGLGFVCGGDVYGGEHGCGLFFCGSHLYHVKNPNLPEGEQWSPQLCERCAAGFMLLADNPQGLLDDNGEYLDVPPEPTEGHLSEREPGEARLTTLEPCPSTCQSTFTPKPDLEHWNKHKMNCPSWQRWREENPEFVVAHKELVDLEYDPEQY